LNFVREIKSIESSRASAAGEVSVRYRIAESAMVALPIRDRGMGDRHIELQTLVGRTLPRVVQIFLDYIKQQLAED
jgi:hypothetical protein